MNKTRCEICGVEPKDIMLMHYWKEHGFDRDAPIGKWRCWCGELFVVGFVTEHLESVDIVEHYALSVLGR